MAEAAQIVRLPITKRGDHRFLKAIYQLTADTLLAGLQQVPLARVHERRCFSKQGFLTENQDSIILAQWQESFIISYDTIAALVQTEKIRTFGIRKRRQRRRFYEQKRVFISDSYVFRYERHFRVRGHRVRYEEVYCQVKYH
jgi:hypothetical protein